MSKKQQETVHWKRYINMYKFIFLLAITILFNPALSYCDEIFTAQDIMNLERNSTTNFNNQFKGKIITVSGYIIRISNSDGYYNIWLAPRPGLNIMNTRIIVCYFHEKEAYELREYGMNSSVIVKGKCGGGFGDGLFATYLEDCKVE